MILYLYKFHLNLILSSFGQNLKTSTFIGEILFAITISIAGLVLFSLLIGNMQVCTEWHLNVHYKISCINAHYPI